MNVFASGRFAPETNDSIVTSLRVAATLVRALVASSTALLRVFQYKQRSRDLSLNLRAYAFHTWEYCTVKVTRAQAYIPYMESFGLDPNTSVKGSVNKEPHLWSSILNFTAF